MSARAWVAFAALGVIWGVPYFFIKVAVQELSPFVIAWGRVTLAAAILLPVAWHRGALRSAGAHLGAILAFAIVEFVVPFSAIGVGERWIDSSTTGILIASVPLTVTLISRYFGVHEPLETWRLVGLVVGLLGVVALLGLGTVSWPLGWAGVGCMLLATVGYAVGPLIIQKYLKGLDSLGPIALSLCASSVLLLIPAAVTLPAADALRVRAHLGRRSGSAVHGGGDAVPVLPGQPRGSGPRHRHHLHQSDRRDAAGRGAVA